jgi:hypothetical protein
MDTGQAIHTVAVFPGAVAAGVAAARQLAATLRGGQLGAYFPQRTFGRVHPEVISEPYLADSTGDAVPSLPGSRPAGMITVVWYDYLPAQVTPERRRAYVAALQQLLPGSVVTYKTHIDDGDWSGAGGNAALEKLAMDTTITNAAPMALSKALNQIRTRPGSVWPRPQFPQMQSEDGYAVRWVPDPSFVSPCDVRTTLRLTGVVAYAKSCDKQLRAAYLAALKTVLPRNVETTVVGATPISSGCQLATSSAWPASQQAAALDLAARLVAAAFPLNGTAFGAASPRPAFLVQGQASTGQQSGAVAGSHLLLASANATGPTTATAAATPLPGAAFVKARSRGSGGAWAPRLGSRFSWPPQRISTEGLSAPALRCSTSSPRRPPTACPAAAAAPQRPSPLPRRWSPSKACCPAPL